MEEETGEPCGHSEVSQSVVHTTDKKGCPVFTGWRREPTPRNVLWLLRAQTHQRGKGVEFSDILFKRKVVLEGSICFFLVILIILFIFPPQLLKLDIGSDIICCKSISYTQIIITEYVTVNTLYYLKMYFNLFCESIDTYSFNFDFESFSPIYFYIFSYYPSTSLSLRLMFFQNPACRLILLF